MNIVELRDRLNAIIAENEERKKSGSDAPGFDRNAMPVFVRVARKGRRKDHFIPLKYACGGRMGFSGASVPDEKVPDDRRFDAMILEADGGDL